MRRSDTIFHYLQSSTLFKWLLKFISWLSFSQNVKGNWAHLAEKNSKPGAKITTIFSQYGLTC